ncbi:MAG: CoA transferase [Burkholderiaceae bacterium]|jgi:crotonobetainyl-CoA:carnitine CoA-transferase CaiB-like acyl-CoA transferase|nr:CoA transferase [Burkholderiaceae bacterium]
MASTPRSQPLRNVRIVSLALNLPGPAALMRLRAMGAHCLKVEPPGAGGATSGDPMGQYNPSAYDVLHQGIRTLVLDLKSERGQARLARQLADADVLLTSFRPSALAKLGLGWKTLRQAYSQLSLVEIVGAPGARAEEPGHDLTYLAEAGLITGIDLPPTLLADMAGALMASEATLACVLHAHSTGKGQYRQVALSQAAKWLALPRTWGLTLPGAAVGGAHAGYAVLPCKDGRVALAALEPHFARALFAAAGLPMPDAGAPFTPQARATIAAWAAGKTCQQLDALAAQHDIPLFTMKG